MILQIYNMYNIGLKWINNINEKKYETLSPFMDKFGL
jgi:hypothetical protein